MAQTLLAPASVLICGHEHTLSNPVNGCRNGVPVTRYQVIDTVTNGMLVNPDTSDVYFYTDGGTHVDFVEGPCIAVDFCTNVVTCVNAALVDPSGNGLGNLAEAVQDSIADAIAGFDYADGVNSWIQENPLSTAANISYDNSIVNELTATNVQDAIDELAVNATQREFETSTAIGIVGSTITLLNAPISDAQLWLHRNGLRLEPTEDYTRAGNVITLVIPPFFNDKFFASYQY